MDDVDKSIEENLTRLMRLDEKILMAQAVLCEATREARIIANELSIQMTFLKMRKMKLHEDVVCVGGDERWESDESS